jgi:hypothetical protein
LLRRQFRTSLTLKVLGTQIACLRASASFVETNFAGAPLPTAFSNRKFPLTQKKDLLSTEAGKSNFYEQKVLFLQIKNNSEAAKPDLKKRPAVDFARVTTPLLVLNVI